MTDPDDEVAAIRSAYRAFASLPPEARDRALAWLSGRLASDEIIGRKAAPVIARFARRLWRTIERKRAA